MKYDEIEDSQLNSLARLASIKVLRCHERLQVEMIAYYSHDKRRHLKVVSSLLE
jgi:hypothetical protein